jgi:hypothetical protein
VCVQLVLFGEVVVQLVLPFDRAGAAGAWQTREVASDKAGEPTGRLQWVQMSRWMALAIAANFGQWLSGRFGPGDAMAVVSWFCLAVTIGASGRVMWLVWAQVHRQADLDTR